MFTADINKMEISSKKYIYFKDSTNLHVFLFYISNILTHKWVNIHRSIGTNKSVLQRTFLLSYLLLFTTENTLCTQAIEVLPYTQMIYVLRYLSSKRVRLMQTPLFVCRKKITWESKMGCCRLINCR